MVLGTDTENVQGNTVTVQASSDEWSISKGYLTIGGTNVAAEKFTVNPSEFSIVLETYAHSLFLTAM